MAVVIFGSNLDAVLTPAQLIVLVLVGTIYPYLATIGTLTGEFGWGIRLVNYRSQPGCRFSSGGYCGKDAGTGLVAALVFIAKVTTITDLVIYYNIIR